MSNARNVSKLGALAAHITNLVGLSNSKTSIDAKVAETPMPAGVMLDFAGSTAPAGYLFAFGQAVSRTTYSALFAAIGTTHGAGDGSTTFNLPDARGRVVAGVDAMGGSAAGRLGSSIGGSLGSVGGAETHTLTVAQMPSHNHSGATAADGGHTPTIATEVTSGGIGSGTRLASGSYTTGARTTNASAIQPVPDHTHVISAQGGGGAHNNTQPTLVLNKIIKT